jgi:23S rRNA pseudouridine955/2504/2580 synthase/23S rRNA pseudouridine1911/1915/1917 synthase
VLVAVQPVTGRVVEPRRIALHAARVVVPDERGSRLVVNAPVPEELSALWVQLGGDADAWQRAILCALG